MYFTKSVIGEMAALPVLSEVLWQDIVIELGSF